MAEFSQSLFRAVGEKINSTFLGQEVLLSSVLAVSRLPAPSPQPPSGPPRLALDGAFGNKGEKCQNLILEANQASCDFQVQDGILE